MWGNALDRIISTGTITFTKMSTAEAVYCIILHEMSDVLLLDVT